MATKKGNKTNCKGSSKQQFPSETSVCIKWSGVKQHSTKSFQGEVPGEKGVLNQIEETVTTGRGEDGTSW